MDKKQHPYQLIRYDAGTIEEIVDEVVTEQPITIKLNGEEYVTVVCTPEYMEDMVVGFLLSEGVVSSYEHIKNIWIQEEEGFAHVITSSLNSLSQDLSQKRYITSCCGKSRQGFVFVNDAVKAKKIQEVNIRLTPKECLQFMNDLQTSSTTFRKTGGVHNAALCNKKGIIIARTDIGRHNALDKIYGYCVKHKREVTGKIIAFSGRVSSEILVKVAKIGCEIILSKSAPTKLALDLATDLGITVVGFIRKEQYNIYTHPERIEL